VVRASIVVTLLCSAATAAHANPLVLERDQIEAVITSEVELAPHQVAKPISFAPDVWLGVTPRLTVGLIHSSASVSRITRGASFCFRHSMIGCDRTYHNGGLDARYALRDGTLAVAVRARFLIRDVDPYKPAFTAGALLHWSRNRIALTADPYLRFGLANTDDGNRTALFVPIITSVRTFQRVELRVHTGYDADLAVWRDGFHIPLALSMRAPVSDSVELGLLGGYVSAFGPQGTLTRRTLWIWLGWRS
jgi:hypothetical protein